MKTPFLIILVHFVFVLMIQSAQAGPIAPMVMDQITVCPASSSELVPPDFSSPDCQAVSAYKIDPQNKLIWVKANLYLEQTSGPGGQPKALYVLAKMSSAFFVNGQFVGQNGQPGIDAASEVPGKMDVSFYPAQSSLKVGSNEVIFLASSHHGALQLQYPIHSISFGTAQNITDAILRHYWPSLLTLGLFLLGTIYFGMKGLVGLNRRADWTLSLICIFAAAQLLAEVYRGLVAYDYPIHDIRLILIMLFSGGFGLSVCFQVLNVFARKYMILVLPGTVVLCGLAVILVAGFDGKAKMAMLIPLITSLVVVTIFSFQRRPRAFVYFLTLLSFITAMFIFPNLFLDVVFFYLVATFLLVLFVEQGLVFAREAAQREAEKARADQLELALEQAAERNQSCQISVRSAGKIQQISTDQIQHCQGAGGYTEIMMGDGRTYLHDASLAEMQDILPSTFLRVHRSHLINANLVKSLTRDPAGTGELVMQSGSKIPVSRRIMPRVRQALI
ncbi:MAG: hypothetical protein COA47_07505 [Robiginitomaculum sp.]|nr:MAG: hypothetical protein COA47_07505 [Robiginitomaculum sp.]